MDGCECMRERLGVSERDGVRYGQIGRLALTMMYPKSRVIMKTDNNQDKAEQQR